MSSGGKSERRFGNVCVCGMRVWEHTDKQRGGAVLVPPPPRGLQVGVPYTEWGGGPRGRLHLRGGRGRQLGAALAWLCLGSQAWESSQSWESASEPGPLRVLMYIHIVSTCSVGAASSSPSARERMQEVIAGLERFPFTFEKDVEMQKGTGLLPFQGMDKSGSAVCNFFAKGLCEKGRLCPFRHDRGEKMVVCKHWLRGLCKKGDQCKFLHQYDVTRMPECYFYSKFGPLCKYRHIRRVMCINYLAGFCPEGSKCQFAHSLAGHWVQHLRLPPGNLSPLPGQTACSSTLRRGPRSTWSPTPGAQRRGRARATGAEK
uniref:Cleavage and polyadenylation specificity factor subunit 4 n=1 Tax=Camelus bactrianus TaxID=9837 RepID=A0A9W3HF32_CAMBA|nr:putative cleavage and polyadenylation specificity factor subunit 4-like protein isoform X2 [Camelus bactrianus]